MSRAHQVLALLKSHISGDDQQFLSIAMQVAAHEARLGHTRVAQQLRDLIDKARQRVPSADNRGAPVLVLQPRTELAGLISVTHPEVRLTNMSLEEPLRARLNRVLSEYKQQTRLREHGLRPRRKLLLLGLPGTGKTMTAAALAGELHQPLLTILLEGVMTKFMGETASKLRLVFDTMHTTEGVYLFDEFDAIGARRDQLNDVGEIRRVLNSFLQMLDKDDSQGLIIAATNHPDLLDPALFRRFDDVLEYKLPEDSIARSIISNRLAAFDTSQIHWDRILEETHGLSQAEIVRASDEAAKQAVLGHSQLISTEDLSAAMAERRAASRQSVRPK
jgi:SpoVK/Ycf46/Vps4 family AAA+-type ATPase